MSEAKDDLKELETLQAEAARLWQEVARTQGKMNEVLLRIARRAAESPSAGTAPSLPLLEEMRDARTVRVRALVQRMRSRDGGWTPVQLEAESGLSARTIGNYLDDALPYGWVRRVGHGRYMAAQPRTDER